MDNEELNKRLSWYSKRYGPYIEKRGLKNWRNLLRKPTVYEWTILFMIIMAYFMSWAYQVDTATCRETLDNLEETCITYCSAEFDRERANEELKSKYGNFSTVNVSQLIIKADSNSTNAKS